MIDKSLTAYRTASVIEKQSFAYECKLLAEKSVQIIIEKEINELNKHIQDRSLKGHCYSCWDLELKKIYQQYRRTVLFAVLLELKKGGFQVKIGFFTGKLHIKW